MVRSNSVTITVSGAIVPLSVSAGGFSNVTYGSCRIGTGFRATVSVSLSGGTPPYSATIHFMFSNGSTTDLSITGSGTYYVDYCSESTNNFMTCTGGSVSVSDSAGQTGSATF